MILYKRVKHFLTSLFCLAVLTQSALAMACHSFGDVHVICKQGHVAFVFIDRETQSEVSHEEEDCCANMVVSDARHHGATGFEAIAIIRTTSPDIVATTPLTHRTAKPREPPSNILF